MDAGAIDNDREWCTEDALYFRLSHTGIHPTDVLGRELKRMFIRHGAVLAVVGVICGLAAAVAVTRLMSSLLFEISPLDPATYAAVSVVLIAAAAIASYVPAHSATAVDAVEALRAE